MTPLNPGEKDNKYANEPRGGVKGILIGWLARAGSSWPAHWSSHFIGDAKG